MKADKEPETPAAARRFSLFFETRSPATRRSYNPGWKRLDGFLSRKKLDFEGMGEEEALDLLHELNAAGASASQIATTSAVVAFAAEAGRSRNPFEGAMVRKVKRSLSTEATITGRTKSRGRRAMTAADYKAFQDFFWSTASSPQDREVCVLAMLTYAAQRRLADLRLLRWGDIDISRSTVTLVIRRHKTSKFYNGAPMRVTVDGTGEADLCRALRAWRTQITEEAGLDGPSSWFCPRIASGNIQSCPAADRTLQRSHAILVERLGLPKGQLARTALLLPLLCRLKVAFRQTRRNDGRPRCRSRLGTCGADGGLALHGHRQPLQQERARPSHVQGSKPAPGGHGIIVPRNCDIGLNSSRKIGFVLSFSTCCLCSLYILYRQ